MATKKTPAKKQPAPRAPKAAPAPKAETPAQAKEPKAKHKRDAADIVHTAFDNEADDGATCAFTLTFTDGSTAGGIAPRTNDLAGDQAAARAQALGD